MFTYEDAMLILKNRTSKKVANNTYLVQLVDCIGVRLHNTIVVQLYPNGTVKLNSGGYQTNTTKNRINRFSPFRIQQKNHVWSVWAPRYDDGTYPGHRFIGLYQDFLTLDHKGRKVA